MVYVSTDYIFDGTNKGEYLEDDPANPKNEYGRAKWAGEEAVRHSGADYYIVRTSWVFGEFGHNFVFTMQNLAKTHDKLTVVNDQLGRPTWTRTLAEFMAHLVKTEAASGTYQLSNDNTATWYDFAKEILKDTDVEVAPVTSEQFPQKAYRPQHSVMNLDKAKATGYQILTWQEALSMFNRSLVEKRIILICEGNIIMALGKDEKTMFAMRINKDEKNKLKALFNDMGLDLSTAVNLFLNKV
ncbi:dTDP-4-dehydrorhamnose reductase [Lactiplantibacillus plantarum subsp. plantarum]|nr:dTDP-4-dehydrorhamnose reductase [Lactiplantibacillus plantarum subsp. plantarum]